MSAARSRAYASSSLDSSGISSSLIPEVLLCVRERDLYRLYEFMEPLRVGRFDGQVEVFDDVQRLEGDDADRVGRVFEHLVPLYSMLIGSFQSLSNSSRSSSSSRPPWSWT